MNPEQFVAVMETIKALGADATTAVIWWLALKHGTDVVACAIIVGGMYLIARLVAKACVSEDRRLQIVRDLLGVGTAGDVTTIEFSQILDKIKRLVAKAP